MRKFDIQSVNNKPDQYWSAMRVAGSSIIGQVAGSAFGDLVFGSDPTESTNQITSDSSKSIALNGNVGTVAAEPFKEFEMSMIISPDQADMWIVKLATDLDEEVGVKINSDWTVSLIWVEDEVLVDRKMIFEKQVSYLALSKSDSKVVLNLNDSQVEAVGIDYEFDGFELGDGTGSISIDKIGIAVTGKLPSINSYFGLFRSQRLDTVARPYGDAAFRYLNDTTRPAIRKIVAGDFILDGGYYYAGIQNTIGGTIAIDCRTGFYTEYSLDNGLSWHQLPAEMVLPRETENVLIRHDVVSDHEYEILARLSPEVSLDLPFANVTVDGDIALASVVGAGLYDAEVNDCSNASITVESDSEIKTIELLGIVDEAPVTDSIGAVYVNGELGGVPAPGKINHFVLILSQASSEVVINAGKNMNIKLAGIGVSEVEYSESDAFYIYNTFAGNTYVSGMDTTEEAKPGVAPNSFNGESASALSLEWSS